MATARRPAGCARTARGVLAERAHAPVGEAQKAVGGRTARKEKAGGAAKAAAAAMAGMLALAQPALGPQPAEAVLIPIGGAPKPTRTLGVVDYGGGLRSLHLCPSTPNCISTAEEANDPTHYVPPWRYPSTLSPSEAMEELAEVIQSTKPDKFTPEIVTKNGTYIYATYTSPTWGFIDDVEFFIPDPEKPLVEYRSASRVGESDFDINRKRIKELRIQLQKKGWKSVGFG